jgi:integrase
MGGASNCRQERVLPPVRLLDLRRAAATLALAASVDLRTVQEQMGHSSIVPTADTYTSVLPEVARTARRSSTRYS